MYACVKQWKLTLYIIILLTGKEEFYKPVERNCTSQFRRNYCIAWRLYVFLVYVSIFYRSFSKLHVLVLIPKYVVILECKCFSSPDTRARWIILIICRALTFTNIKKKMWYDCHAMRQLSTRNQNDTEINNFRLPYGLQQLAKPITHSQLRKAPKWQCKKMKHLNKRHRYV